MAAAVGIRDSGDADVTHAGTFNQATTKPASQGGTVTQTFGAGDLVASAQIQVSAAVTNPFQEVNLFIGELARKLGVAPRAAAKLLVDMTKAMFEQAYN